MAYTYITTYEDTPPITFSGVSYYSDTGTYGSQLTRTTGVTVGAEDSYTIEGYLSWSSSNTTDLTDSYTRSSSYTGAGGTTVHHGYTRSDTTITSSYASTFHTGTTETTYSTEGSAIISNTVARSLTYISSISTTTGSYHISTSTTVNTMYGTTASGTTSDTYMDGTSTLTETYETYDYGTTVLTTSIYSSSAGPTATTVSILTTSTKSTVLTDTASYSKYGFGGGVGTIYPISDTASIATVYIAEPGEVLWFVTAKHLTFGALSEHAVSFTRTTWIPATSLSVRDFATASPLTTSTNFTYYASSASTLTLTVETMVTVAETFITYTGQIPATSTYTSGVRLRSTTTITHIFGYGTTSSTEIAGYSTNTTTESLSFYTSKSYSITTASTPAATNTCTVGTFIATSSVFTRETRDDGLIYGRAGSTIAGYNFVTTIGTYAATSARHDVVTFKYQVTADCQIGIGNISFRHLEQERAMQSPYSFGHDGTPYTNVSAVGDVPVQYPFTALAKSRQSVYIVFAEGGKKTTLSDTAFTFGYASETVHYSLSNLTDSTDTTGSFSFSPVVSSRRFLEVGSVIFTNTNKPSQYLGGESATESRTFILGITPAVMNVTINASGGGQTTTQSAIGAFETTSIGESAYGLVIEPHLIAYATYTAEPIATYYNPSSTTYYIHPSL